MRNGIQFRLTLGFGLIFILGALAASALSFYTTYRGTYELQDDFLQQVFNYVNPQKEALPRLKDDTQVQVFLLNDPASKRLFPAMDDGFHTLQKEKGGFRLIKEKKERRFFFMLKNAGELYRAYVRNTPQGTVVILQDSEYREDLAEAAAGGSVLPMAIFLGLLILCMHLIIRRSLRPVVNLSKELETRQETDLTPLPVAEIPKEIHGFVVEINRLLARTDSFIQQQKRFIADASHELRSPMTALSLQIEQLTQEPMPAATKAQLGKVQQGVRRSRNLLEQLLSLSRLQNAKEKPQSALSCEQIFRHVLEDVYPLALEKDQDIGVVSTQDVQIMANETDLYLLVKTLVDNAIRYCPQGSQIDLSATQQHGEICLLVEDNGAGIPEEERQRVLDPFYRILGSGEQGSGLGLAIAQEIVKQYQGHLLLKDAQSFEQGLRVEIYLPRA